MHPESSVKGLLIESVLAGSIAEEEGIEAGDRLVAIDGNPIRDLIDYHYWYDGDLSILDIQKPDGTVWECEVESSDAGPLGLVFEAPDPARCRNNCIFCFVHQLPKGLRPPLYVKDEDYRLSFLYGNYVTMANITKKEVERIKKLRLSPLYISVHATDPELRAALLGRTGAPPVLDLLKELADARIIMHTQVVLCPGVNDGAALEKTVADLAALHPHVASLAIVPVGLTVHRRKLPELVPITAGYAADFIAVWQPIAEQYAAEKGEPFLFLADEFFLKAAMPFPPISCYGDFPQLENGVGMIPLFRVEAAKVLRKARRLAFPRAVVVTGVSAFPEITAFLKKLSQKTGVEFRPVAVENRLFGPSVTVTGLVSGRDIIAAVGKPDPREVVIVPDVMLKEGEGLFLDDLSIPELERELGVSVLVSDSSPAGLYSLISGS
jgi:putative radical SAM enzyme (TIGR03279 family)